MAIQNPKPPLIHPAHTQRATIGHNTRSNEPPMRNIRSLRADARDSTCFSALKWVPDETRVEADKVDEATGTVYATFRDGSQYEYQMTRAEFEEWRDDNSLGGYFNEGVR